MLAGELIHQRLREGSACTNHGCSLKSYQTREGHTQSGADTVGPAVPVIAAAPGSMEIHKIGAAYSEPGRVVVCVMNVHGTREGDVSGCGGGGSLKFDARIYCINLSLTSRHRPDWQRESDVCADQSGHESLLCFADVAGPCSRHRRVNAPRNCTSIAPCSPLLDPAPHLSRQFNIYVLVDTLTWNVVVVQKIFWLASDEVCFTCSLIWCTVHHSGALIGVYEWTNHQRWLLINHLTVQTSRDYHERESFFIDFFAWSFMFQAEEMDPVALLSMLACHLQRVWVPAELQLVLLCGRWGRG